MRPQYTDINQVPWWNRDLYSVPSYGRTQAQPMMPQQSQMLPTQKNVVGLLGRGFGVSDKNPGTLGAEMYTNYVNNLLLQNAPQVAPQPQPQPQGVFNFSQAPVRKNWLAHLEDRGGGSA